MVFNYKWGLSTCVYGPVERGVPLESGLDINYLNNLISWRRCEVDLLIIGVSGIYHDLMGNSRE